MNAVLHTAGLTVQFGGLKACNEISLDVHEGELLGLIGPNGAGKTTFINGITGFVPASGSVMFDGDEVLGWAPHRIAHRGLTRTWQSLELFGDISVRENLEVAATKLTPGKAVRDYFGSSQRVAARVDATIEALEMHEVLDARPDDLSMGYRKLVGVARALVAEAKLVLLDEPAAGLDRSETSWLAEKLRDVIDYGTSILLVDHDMGLVLNVCDRIHVIDFGKTIAIGTPAEIRTDEAVIGAYLGSSGGGES
jgi:branched-chain amino acid transport system ATP-binding protein